jgi:hypothetical protein
MQSIKGFWSSANISNFIFEQILHISVEAKMLIAKKKKIEQCYQSLERVYSSGDEKRLLNGYN